MPVPCPPGWHDWEIALEDEMLARTYGWTISEIDSLTDGQRERVRYWRAVRAIYIDAEQFLADWRRKNAGVVSMVDRLKARGGP